MTTTKKPAFIAYAVTGEGKDAFWTRIGSVWQHNHGEGAYSARSRTPFRCDGGQHSAVMADTVPR